MKIWQYQSAFAWSDTRGYLSDQARLWLNALYKTVTTAGEGPVQLGGDIGGTSTSPIVIGLQSNPVSAVAPVNGQVLTWDGTHHDWAPQTPAATALTQETPAGTLDGVNTVFTLSAAPNPAASLLLFLNGDKQLAGTDFTMAGTTITYTVAPVAADWHAAYYLTGLGAISGGGGGVSGSVGVAGITIDGGGTTPAAGFKGFLQVPYAGTISRWTVLADASGSAQITVKKSTYSGFPATVSIVAAAPPNLASAQKGTSSTLPGWTTAVAQNDVLEFDLDSASALTWLNLELQITKS
jgi:hypothetical protein